ncbi:hypothetical protein [Lentzea albidocapillata]|uniref:hypothetical protein n=1 Tax=Lentzea albidocapillata TaxID=40571 RepID=UPI0004C4436F|nr:hypothetical protein [Lentzea albidocapillata]
MSAGRGRRHRRFHRFAFSTVVTSASGGQGTPSAFAAVDEGQVLAELEPGPAADSVELTAAAWPRPLSLGRLKTPPQKLHRTASSAPSALRVTVTLVGPHTSPITASQAGIEPTAPTR